MRNGVCKHDCLVVLGFRHTEMKPELCSMERAREPSEQINASCALEEASNVTSPSQAFQELVARVALLCGRALLRRGNTGVRSTVLAADSETLLCTLNSCFILLWHCF